VLLDPVLRVALMTEKEEMTVTLIFEPSMVTLRASTATKGIARSFTR
jgi:hypothetical protein